MPTAPRGQEVRVKPAHGRLEHVEAHKQEFADPIAVRAVRKRDGQIPATHEGRQPVVPSPAAIAFAQREAPDRPEVPQFVVLATHPTVQRVPTALPAQRVRAKPAHGRLDHAEARKQELADPTAVRAVRKCDGLIPATHEGRQPVPQIDRQGIGMDYLQRFRETPAE